MEIEFYRHKDTVKELLCLAELQSEMSEKEKNLITEENYKDCFLAFVSNGLITRAKYILQTFPDFLRTNWQDYITHEDKINTSALIYTDFLPILSYAVIKLNDTKIVENLLKLGIDPNHSKRSGMDETSRSVGYCPLSDAISITKNFDMVKLLLEYGADPNGSESVYNRGYYQSKYSRLSEAILINNTSIVELLLKYGADPKKSHHFHLKRSNPYFHNSYSPLGDAINNKNIDMVRLLLEHGAEADKVEKITNVNGIGHNSCSMLTYAITKAESQEIVSLLIQYGAVWDHVIDYDGITKVEKKFPYQKYISKDFAKFLKTQGWKGSIFYYQVSDHEHFPETDDWDILPHNDFGKRR